MTCDPQTGLYLGLMIGIVLGFVTQHIGAPLLIAWKHRADGP